MCVRHSNITHREGHFFLHTNVGVPWLSHSQFFHNGPLSVAMFKSRSTAHLWQEESLQGSSCLSYSGSANGTATARRSGEAASQHSGVACFAWVDILFFNYFRSHVFALSDWIRIFSRIYVRHLHFLFMPNKIRALSNKLTFPVSSYIFSLYY